MDTLKKTARIRAVHAACRAQSLARIRNQMFDECCGLVYGNCSSDNEAQRIVNAIRITKDGTNTQTPKSYTSMFVTEYLYIDNNEGPTLVRLPKADWPEWATSLLK